MNFNVIFTEVLKACILCTVHHLQNIWHVQHTNAQINGNIIDNIKPKTQGIQIGYIPMHQQTTSPHTNGKSGTNDLKGKGQTEKIIRSQDLRSEGSFYCKR